MQPPLRVYDPQYLHEITLRINGGDHLLDMNSQQLRSQFLGAMAKSAKRYGIRVVAFHFLSNHYHGLFAIPSASMFVRFLTAFHAALATIVNGLRGKTGRVWSENKWMPVAQDPVTVAQRIRYILHQAVAARLVDHPIQFPGPSSTEWMVDGTALIGEVVEATRKYRDSRLKDGARPDEEYITEVQVPMAPPPCWAGLDEVGLRQLYRGLADEGARVQLAVLRSATEAVLTARDTWHGPDTSTDQQGLGQYQLDVIDCEMRDSGLAVLQRPDKVRVINRVDSAGRPYSPGKVKPKERQPRPPKRIWIHCADQELREEYGRRYLQLADVYHAAKCQWKNSATLRATGLKAPGFHIPPHTLAGSMPLVD